MNSLPQTSVKITNHLYPLPGKDYTSSRHFPDDSATVKWVKRSGDIGNRETKFAWGGNSSIKVGAFPSVVGKTNGAKFSRTFKYQGDTYAYGTEAESLPHPIRMLPDLRALPEARKIGEFGLFFRALLAHMTKLKKTDEVQAIRLALSTSASPDDYKRLRECVESITSLTVNGIEYSYRLKVDAIVPEGWGVIQAQKLLSDRGFLLDIGHGTVIISRLNGQTSELSGDTLKPEDVGQKLESEGCAGVYTAWAQESATYTGNVSAPIELLSDALVRGKQPNGYYEFCKDRSQNKRFNKALRNAIDLRWEAMMENLEIRTAIEKAFLDGDCLYACGGGAHLFEKQLVREGFKIIPQASTANVRGMQGWLNVQSTEEGYTNG